MKRKSPVKTDSASLPPDVKAGDLKHVCRYGDKAYTDDMQAKDREIRNAGHYGALTFYLVKNTGWVLTTLHISNPSRRQASGTPARTYGIGVADSKVYTVGRGPHVEKEVTVYLDSTNIDRLQRYADLWVKGMEDASAIRDRISSRRAQGQLHRAAGESHWRW